MQQPNGKMAGAGSFETAPAPTNEPSQDRSPGKSNFNTQPPVVSKAKLVYSVQELCEVLGISLSTAYEALRQGAIPSIRVSKRRYLIPCAAIYSMLAAAGGQHDGK